MLSGDNTAQAKGSVSAAAGIHIRQACSLRAAWEARLASHVHICIAQPHARVWKAQQHARGHASAHLHEDEPPAVPRRQHLFTVGHHLWGCKQPEGEITLSLLEACVRCHSWAAVPHRAPAPKKTAANRRRPTCSAEPSTHTTSQSSQHATPPAAPGAAAPLPRCKIRGLQASSKRGGHPRAAGGLRTPAGHAGTLQGLRRLGGRVGACAAWW